MPNETAAGDLSVTYLGMGKNYYNMAENTCDTIARERCLLLALECTKKCREIRISEIRKGNKILGFEVAEELQKKIEEMLYLFFLFYYKLGIFKRIREIFQGTNKD